MKKRILKITALVLAIVLIVGVGLFANSLVGNPISEALARNTAKKYISETYSGTDYVLESVSYSFKDGYYHAYVSSPSSVDTSFPLYINGFGKLKYDNYENNVTSGWNTATRLGGDYRRAVDAIIESSSFPCSINFGYGELVFISLEDMDVPEVPEYAFITNELTLDAYYNVSELGARSGRLTLYLKDENVSSERLAEMLLDIRKCFDDAGIGFYSIDCVLEYPQTEDGVYLYGRVEVMEFRYSDIYEDGLIERVEASNQAALDYYSLQDIEKYVEKPIETE